MRIWFDVDNAPHVLVIKPIAEELTQRGHTVIFTARDRSSTCELLDLYNLDYIKVGGLYRNSTFGKVTGTIRRAFALRKAMKKWHADVSFGHGSRALPLTSAMLKVPSITMYDYEWVNPSLFNRFCSMILLPDVITLERCREAGIDSDKVSFFPGFKENLYLNNVEPDPSIAAELGLKDDKIKVLLRPPATTAHYHNPEAEEILDALLAKLLNNPEVQLIWIPRTPDQNELVGGIHKAEVIIPEKVYPGPQLILTCDVVIGGGGTMTREAAVLGVPSFTFFMGRLGAVDSALHNSNKLQILRNKEEVAIFDSHKTKLSVYSAGYRTISAIVDYILN
ncbi:MAG: DUF354 domain-containing protein [Candidatus Aegiribacteria sp.]|nr:DUF354 domain-containing protein [Candidatus Aegiribacteria sp.]